jgi:methyl-accepting chemotaxis protein
MNLHDVGAKEMKKLSFKFKMMLSIVSFTVPITILSVLMYKAHTVNIDFGAREIDGNRYQKPLQKILEAVSWHRVYANRAVAGENESNAKVSDLASTITSGFESLEKIDAEIGEKLEFTVDGLAKRKRTGFSVNDMKQIWADLKKSPTSDELHLKLIAGIRVMIAHLGDTSNLILDPDLDSYYLMDVSLLALPQTQDRIADIIVNVEKILKKESISASDRIQIAVYAALLKDSDVVRVSNDIQTSLNEDAGFYGPSETLQSKVSPVIAPYVSHGEKAVTLLNKVANSADATFPINDFRSTFEPLLSASFNAWPTASEELENLLKVRVAHLSKDRFSNLAISLLIWFFSCVFAFRISQSLTASIADVVKKLSETGVNVGQSSSKLSSTSQSLSSTTTQSAASLEESVSSVEELTSMVKRTAESSKTVSNLSEETELSTIDGETKIKDLVGRMNQISAESKKVEDIIGVIDDIAFQTNLLALNAAVEAARAGEQGKGFAVVADSVRSLASKSAEAAKEISRLIKSNVESIHSGADLAEKCGQSLELISGSIKKVSELNKEVAQACEEQSNGLAQISEALNSLDTVTQTNAASSEDVASTSEVLFTESQAMQNHMGSLYEVVYGKKKAA